MNTKPKVLKEFSGLSWKGCDNRCVRLRPARKCRLGVCRFGGRSQLKQSNSCQFRLWSTTRIIFGRWWACLIVVAYLLQLTIRRAELKSKASIFEEVVGGLQSTLASNTSFTGKVRWQLGDVVQNWRQQKGTCRQLSVVSVLRKIRLQLHMSQLNVMGLSTMKLKQYMLRCVSQRTAACSFQSFGVSKSAWRRMCIGWDKMQMNRLDRLCAWEPWM